MRQSQLFYKSRKEAPKDAEIISHKLLVRADFIDQLIAGVYSFLPLGWRVHKKIEQIIREEMNTINGQEVFLPVLQPRTLWEETDRWERFDPPLFKLKDRHNKDLALGPTHEEVITDLVRKRVESYKDLPFYLYQIQNKFRNEMRPTGGLLRVREFMMKDLYSFHVDEKDLIRYYKQVEKAYIKIFERCGLKAIPMEADSGTIGGSMSHEFAILAESGESIIFICPKCGWAVSAEKKKSKYCVMCKTILQKESCIEGSHGFNLGIKYSKTMGALFTDKDGKKKPIVMGCYGLGLGRLMATIVEVYHDADGIIWPKQVAPFDVHLITFENNEKVKSQAEKIYNELQKNDFEVLYDDRKKETAGIKFIEADLIGIPIRLIVSEKTLKKQSVEFKKRNEKKVKIVKIKDILKNV